MRGLIGLFFILAILAAVLAVLNPDLLARQVDVNLFGRPYQGPLAVVLLVIGPGAWVLLLLAASWSDWQARRRDRAMDLRIAARDQEILALKAAAYDRQHPVTADDWSITERPPVESRVES